MISPRQPEFRAAIYARVSTHEQHPEAQLRELRAYCERRGWQWVEYVDRGVSGRRSRRPGLDRLLGECRRRTVDRVLVWSLDRLSRSVRDLLETVESLDHWGVGLTVLTQPIDTSTAMGKLLLQVLGAVAEFEAALIRERTMAGVASARAEGRVPGRPRVTSTERVEALVQSGCTVEQAAAHLGVSVATVYRRLQGRQREAG